jgi:hypothetical protein
MAEALGEGESRLSAQQDAILEQMISEKLTAISNRYTAQVHQVACGMVDIDFYTNSEIFSI